MEKCCLNKLQIFTMMFSPATFNLFYGNIFWYLLEKLLILFWISSECNIWPKYMWNLLVTLKSRPNLRIILMRMNKWWKKEVNHMRVFPGFSKFSTYRIKRHPEYFIWVRLKLRKRMKIPHGWTNTNKIKITTVKKGKWTLMEL